MNHFYNQVYGSFFAENVSFLDVFKKSFSEEFHKEERHQYKVRPRGWESEGENTATGQNPSTTGYLLREKHISKSHDSSIITINFNQVEQVKNFVQEIEDKVKSDLQSSILAKGKIKADQRTSYKLDEVISELRQLKTKLVSTRSKLTDLGRKASNLF